MLSWICSLLQLLVCSGCWLVSVLDCNSCWVVIISVIPTMTVMPSWRGLCRQSGVAPLKLVPFLPQDNSSSSSSRSGDNTGSSTNTLARANAELGRCLSLPFPVFLSFVLEDAALGKFMDTFLRCDIACSLNFLLLSKDLVDSKCTWLVLVSACLTPPVRYV